jgi:Holliday junction resolvase RusA-like endonuclease
MKIKIQIRPLSVNKAWQGRRFKTKEYKRYEKDVLYLLPRKCPLEGELFVRYVFYLKNYKISDNDNPVKPLQDIMVKKGIIKDDRFIKGTLIIKEPVKDIKDEKIVLDIVQYEDRMSVIK